ncbi:hypothetical protein GCM10010464_57220 [Pseudonocardia yunnanensis]
MLCETPATRATSLLVTIRRRPPLVSIRIDSAVNVVMDGIDVQDLEAMTVKPDRGVPGSASRLLRPAARPRDQYFGPGGRT